MVEEGLCLLIGAGAVIKGDICAARRRRVSGSEALYHCILNRAATSY